MQDRIVVDIGKLSINKKGNLEPFEYFIQNVFPDKVNYQIMIAAFNVDSNNNIYFSNIDIENGSSENFLKYGYRKGSSRGGDITFTTKVSESFETKLKTLKNSQILSFIQAAKKSKQNEEHAILISLSEYLKDELSFNSLNQELQNVYDSLDKEKQLATAFSIRFNYEVGTKKYVGDFKTFQNILLLSGTEDKSFKYGVTSEGFNEKCSICFETKEHLYGFASPFKYFTVDKPSFVSGFFKQENTWRNYPICADCSLQFEVGRDYISNKLQSYFYGKPFYFIPKLVKGSNPKLLEKVLKRLNEVYLEASTAKAQKIYSAEDKIMELVAENENYFLLNIMFFEEDSKTKAIKIRLLLEEVLPSRFQTLFVEIPNEINKHALYTNAITTKAGKINLRFNFGILKGFFNEDFLEIVHIVFEGKKISKEVLFSRFMEKIRMNYNKAQSTSDYVEATALTLLKAHLVLRYSQKLKLNNYQIFEYMDSFENKIKNKQSAFNYDLFKEFIKSNPDFFDSDLKVGVFGLGILVKYVMNKQYTEIKSTPFEKKLKGYDLSVNDLTKIYLEAKDKATQYNIGNAYPELREQVLPKFLLNKHNPEKLGKNEVSLYFVAGLEWAGQFKNKDQEVNENN